MDQKQKRIFKSMEPEQKLEIALNLNYSAKELKAAGLRVQNPDWPENKILDKLQDIFLYART